MIEPATLAPTPFIDADHPAVIAYARAAAGGAADPRERAVRLYLAVRDDVYYDPYGLDLTVEGLRASTTLARRRGWCVAKAILLAACARAEGIPARLAFADVRNHLNTAKLRAAMGTDVFAFHGNTELHLGGRWVKATPAFNRALCERFGVAPLEFDGIHDSVFQPFDGEGKEYMEYLRDHGRHADLPLANLRRAFEDAYPSLMAGGVCDLSGRFEEEGVGQGRRRRHG